MLSRFGFRFDIAVHGLRNASFQFSQKDTSLNEAMSLQSSRSIAGVLLLWTQKLCQPADFFFFLRNSLASGIGKIIYYRASMFDSIFWSIIFYSALVCIISTILCTLAPLAAWQTFFAWFGLAMPDGLYDFRLSLILDMKKIPDHMVFWICLKYALRFFVLYGREIVLSVTVIYFFPLIKSEYSSSYRSHRRSVSVMMTLPLCFRSDSFIKLLYC